MPRVVHFEVPADDPQRAIRFYQEMFGWQTQKWEGQEDYYLVMTGEGGPGIDGAIMRRSGPGGVVNTVDVPSLDQYIEKVSRAGGTIVLPRTVVPGVGYLAYAADTEGNVFGMMEMDTSAA